MTHTTGTDEKRENMKKELRYIKIGNLEFKDKDGTLCVRKEIFPGSPTWYIAEVPDLIEAIQATREETIEEIENVDLTEKYQEKAQDLWDTNDFDDSEEAEHWDWLAHNYDEVIDDILYSLAQKKGIRR